MTYRTKNISEYNDLNNRLYKINMNFFNKGTINYVIICVY